MKIYVVGDGRRLYAVAAKSKKAAVAAFNTCPLCRFQTVYNLSKYGMTWDMGQVPGTHVIIDKPGVVFVERASQKWQKV